MPSGTIRVWIPTVKTWSQRLSEMPIGPGGLSARTSRTVRLGPADCSPGNRGPSAWSTRAAHVLSSVKVNNGPSAVDYPPGSAFSRKNFAKKSQVWNKSQKPADRPPEGPRLSAQHLKTDFSQDFQRNPFNKWNCHSSKCNACKSLIKVALWKVKPMKLTPFDSTTIYPINPVF
jgi:hypothetical protein